MPLFDITNGRVSKLDPTALGKEKQIQGIFENNLPTLLNIDLVKSEHVTSTGGRIDTLGLDRNGSPVIIEYKKTQNDNVINQSLSYLKWPLDRKADFEMLCQKMKITRDNPILGPLEGRWEWLCRNCARLEEIYGRLSMEAMDGSPVIRTSVQI